MLCFDGANIGQYGEKTKHLAPLSALFVQSVVGEREGKEQVGEDLECKGEELGSALAERGPH